MTLRVIKETKRYGRTDGRTHGHTDGRTDNVKTVYPLQTKFAGGIKMPLARNELTICILVTHKCALWQSKDTDEMPHNVAFQQSLYCLLIQNNLQRKKYIFIWKL